MCPSLHHMVSLGLAKHNALLCGASMATAQLHSDFSASIIAVDIDLSI